jgi:hypothetical protein
VRTLITVSNTKYQARERSTFLLAIKKKTPESATQTNRLRGNLRIE